MAKNLDLKSFIRNIPDFPKPGIMFRDITPLLANAEAFGESIRQFADHFRDEKPTAILAAEARGFIFAAPLALELGVSFVPFANRGKLPLIPMHFTMNWNMAATRWNCIPMRLAWETAYCWSTTYWPPAAPCRPARL